MLDSNAYLIIDLGSILIPFLYSFDKRIRFSSHWKGLFTGILVMMVVFITWDIAFTYMGVWGFNPRYITGIDVVNLPLEEWLFFVCIPYACLFIYEAMRYFVRRDVLGNIARPFSLLLAAVLLVLGLLNLDKWYTSVTFLLTSGFLAYIVLVIRADYLGRFYLGYLISLIPFFIVNGILTGSWIPDQVVWYNDAENLGIRMGTIPVEDSIYMMLMLLIVTVVYENFRKRSNLQQQFNPKLL